MENDKPQKLITDKNFLQSLAIGAVLLVASLSLNYFATNYAVESISQPVTDIVLSNIPLMDVDGVIITLSLSLLIITVIYALRKPKIIPFLLKSGALFIFIRSIFISLTHIGPFASQLVVTANPVISLGLGKAGDLFFSGHTGLPFLAALTFWNNRILRLIYLLGSLFLGTLVLLGHFHYSIDVLGAFFITYSIHQMATYLFKKDWQLFNS